MVLKKLISQLLATFNLDLKLFSKFFLSFSKFIDLYGPMNFFSRPNRGYANQQCRCFPEICRVCLFIFLFLLRFLCLLSGLTFVFFVI